MAGWRYATEFHIFYTVSTAQDEKMSPDLALAPLSYLKDACADIHIVSTWAKQKTVNSPVISFLAGLWIRCRSKTQLCSRL